MYECTATGCNAPTPSHYCDAHRQHCSECGTEIGDGSIFGDGKCFECDRIDRRGYDASCSCADCAVSS